MMRLRPIKRLRRVTPSELSQMVRHFERRAKGATIASELAQRRRLEKPDKPKQAWTSLESVREALNLPHAIYESGRFTWEEYFFHSAMPVEHLNDHRHSMGDYDAELKPISLKLKEIEAKHGLRDDQYWPIGEGPAEHNRLNARYERILDLNLGNLFYEVGLKNHGRLWLKNRAEFNRLREAGRASAFEAADIEHATAKLIDMYEREAKKCAKAEAYYAACVMVGSACEALLLLKCIQEPNDLSTAKDRLPKSKGFHKGGPQFWNLAQLVEVTREAGWVANLATENVIINIVNLVAHLQDLRNLVHPGRHAVRRPHLSIGQEQYEDARSAYFGLRYALEKTHPLRGRPTSR